MSLNKLLNHACDIYHAITGNNSPGFNLPSEPKISYSEIPNICAQPCHFGVKGASISINQTAPINIENAKIKLTLPVGTDIRLNDKVVRCDTGEEYTAERPIDIRGHHIYVYIKKLGKEGYL